MLPSSTLGASALHFSAVPSYTSYLRVVRSVKAETECPLYMFSNTKLSVQKKHLNKTQVASLSLCNQSESSFHHTPWLICVSFSRRTRIVKEVLNGEANPKTEGRDGHFEFESNFLNLNFKLFFFN